MQFLSVSSIVRIFIFKNEFISVVSSHHFRLHFHRTSLPWKYQSLNSVLNHFQSHLHQIANIDNIGELEEHSDKFIPYPYGKNELIPCVPLPFQIQTRSLGQWAVSGQFSLKMI